MGTEDALMMGTDGAKFEFFLSAAIPASTDDSNFMQRIDLLKEVVDPMTMASSFEPVASASYEATEMLQESRNFQIFYKGEVAKDTTDNYKI